MDRWKRTSDSVIVNDDSTGYENAKMRAASRNRKKEQIEGIEERIDSLERKVHGMELTIGELVKICRSITNAMQSR